MYCRDTVRTVAHTRVAFTRVACTSQSTSSRRVVFEY
jgi:hypothetical protein